MKKFTAAIICALLTAALSIGAAAAEYEFYTRDTTDYYKSTLYEDVYGSGYNYGGVNVVDFAETAELPGLFMPPMYGEPTAPSIVSNGYEYGDSAASVYAAPVPAFTPASELVRSDGSIGTLEIPSLGIKMNVFEGTDSASMAKGAGHFADSSGWNGNICLAGHNRLAKYTIGTIKNLKPGDVIKYTTSLGARTYSVTFVGQIDNTDWTYLGQTADNRITLITCLADKPSLRVCVQAVEVR